MCHPVNSRKPSAFKIVRSGREESQSPERKPISFLQLPNLTLRQSERRRNLSSQNQQLSSSTLPEPTYFKEQLKRVLVHKSISSQKDKIYYEQFLKNVKDLSNMSKDFLFDEEEYLDKIRLRRVLKEQDSAFLEGESALPLLVLDLDETLIHCLKPDAESNDFTVKTGYSTGNGQWVAMRVNVRPMATEFLQEMSNHFTIFVFTASEIQYAKTAVKLVDPDQRYIRRVLDRRFCCVTKKGFLVKDLRIFAREQRVKQILLVDNSSYCFFPQLKNGVPIVPFEQNQADRELLDLMHYLIYLRNIQSSMVAFNSEYFKLQRYGSSGRLDSIVTEIF